MSDRWSLAATAVTRQSGLLLDFVADDTADNGTANSSRRAAAGQNGTTDGTDTGADSRVLALPRHARTSPQTEHQHDGEDAG